MPRHVFVLGLDDFQRGELENVREPDAYEFHPLLDLYTLITAESYDFRDLLDQARDELDAFPGSVDAIIRHWDFPTSVLGAILAHEHDVPAPSLESLLACEHKYWSRSAQAEAVPQCTPGFALFDPFDDDPLDAIDVPFPFFVKPVKGHSSQLSFKITDADHFHDVLPAIREGVGRMGTPFDQAMEMADVPNHVRGVSAAMCLAEEMIDGVQAAPEGSVHDGEFHVHGVVDQPPDEDGKFSRIDYPSALPIDVQNRMVEAAEAYLTHVDFDNGCFNAEFMWDEPEDTLWLVEVNTRISQSHSDLFSKVDGMSNHEVALDVALGQPPSLASHEGPFLVATKIMLTHDADGIVTRVPSQEDIHHLQDRFPETKVMLQVGTGDRLAELVNQEGDRYELAEIYLGGQDRAEIEAGHQACRELLQFEFEDIDASP